ncbi:MAG: lactate racemase domain-containing protein [Planctomycetota bacterium]
MTLLFAAGEPDADLAPADLRNALASALNQLGAPGRVLAVPPDFTRKHSQAGPITCALHELLGERLTDVLPALGTHEAMTADELGKMYPTVPRDLFRVHRWREDIVTLGQVPADYVDKQTEGAWSEAWPAQTNKLVAAGGHDLIFSIGQVVPHEVIGMANYNKNIFVGAGGVRGINESHFLSAAFGMERIMGRADNPLRRIMNYAQDHFCRDLPIVYVLTVVSDHKIRGLFIGDDVECFERAAALSLEVNFDLLPEQPAKVVVSLDPEEFKSTWLGNKAIYRTRMAIADGGELVVLAPGVRTFGEDAAIDRLIRKHGYRTTPEVLEAVNTDPELRANLSAAAHLIHGSPEGRFTVTYCPGHLTREEIEGVGYQYGDLAEMTANYAPKKLSAGWNQADGERFYYIPNPALGLWAHRSRLPA